MTAPLVLLLPLLILPIALALLWFALRGHKIDSHPLCRKCKFDLYNKPLAADRCPECGADLQKPGAIVIGRRRPYVTAAVVAGALLVFGLLWAGAIGTVAFSGPRAAV